jgi:methyl-accepting chemotaxis protein
MSTIVIWFKTAVLVLTIAALGLVAFPVANAYALEASGPPTPATPGPISNDKLEQIWAKVRSAYDKIGTLLDRSDEFIAKVQKLIDRAKSNGKDVSAVQVALDAFAEAVKQAQPVYESAKGIVSAHQGFDENGKVTDAQKAIQTIRDLRDKLKEIRQIISGPARALREAIKAFRQANKPTPAPASPDER